MKSPIKPLERAGKKIVIPTKANRKNPRLLTKTCIRRVHLIENFFARLKQFRGIATRYDKTAKNFLAAVFMVGAYVWLSQHYAISF